MKEYNRGASEAPLVLIGGAFQNIAQVERLSHALSKQTWVITFDTPGNGATGVLPHDYPFEFICECIESALNTLLVEQINLVGFSYGSIIAMRFAQMYPLMIHRLVLGGAMEGLPETLLYEFHLMLFYLKWNKVEAFADRFTNLMSNRELRATNRLAKLAGEKLHYALSTANRGIREQFWHNTQRIIDFGKTDLSALPDLQTTVFTGTQDMFVPPEANQRIASAVPRGCFVPIANADHMVHVIQFKKTVEVILRGVGALVDEITPHQPATSYQHNIIPDPDLPSASSEVWPLPKMAQQQASQTI
jgi:pimeloyl-ACP methyl ester carboxylesterase